MAAGKELSLPVTDDWQIHPVDADNTAVVFSAGEYTNGAILANDALSRFVAGILHSAIKYAQNSKSSLRRWRTSNGHPDPGERPGCNAGTRCD